ncbi:MAG: FtsK/SpoIIIE domain-containing protein [bacterium]
MLEGVMPSWRVIGELIFVGMMGLPIIKTIEDLKKSKGVNAIFIDFFETVGLYSTKKDGEKIFPEFKGVEVNEGAEKAKIYRYTIPKGKDIGDFEKHKKALEHQLCAQCRMWAEDNLIAIEVWAEKLPREVDFNASYIKKQLSGKQFATSIGFSRKGFIINEHTKSTPHMQVSGSTDSGKSGFIRQLLISVISWYTDKQVQICLIDLKGGVELGWFRMAPHVKAIKSQKTGRLINGVVTTKTEVLELFKVLNEEMDRRTDIIRKAGVENIHNLGSLQAEMPYMLIVVDEFAEIQDKAIIEQLSRLLRMARACGMYLILSMQRPEAKILPGELKSNLAVSVAFRAKTKIDSRIALDNQEAARIPPIPGRGIYQVNDNIDIQVPFITVDEAKKILKQRRRELGYEEYQNNSSFINNQKIKKDSVQQVKKQEYEQVKMF